jgi:hypothetical protein
MAMALSILTAPLGGSYIAGRGAHIGRYRSFLHHRLQLLPAVRLPGGTPNFSVKGKDAQDTHWTKTGAMTDGLVSIVPAARPRFAPRLPFYQQARSNVPPIIRLSNVGSLYRPWLLAFNVEST